MGIFNKIKNKLSGDLKESKENSTSGPKKNFQYLDKLVHSGQKEIFLDYNIVLETEFPANEHMRYMLGIQLDVDDLVIDGQGHTIDAKNRAVIFHCMGKNISLKNITFKNANSKVENGGALKNDENSCLNIINCSFIKNVSNDGGAINNLGELSLENCKFIDNTVNNGGGAIANNKDAIININNTDFENNSSNNGGGAIANLGEIHLNDCKFSNNSAKMIGGAVINNSNTVFNITATKFIKNQANTDGGAIVNSGEMSLDDCEFSENNAKNYGGVISNQPLAKLTIHNTDFINNKLNSYALLLNSGILNLNGGVFKDNYSKKGDSVIFSEAGASISCYNYEFINNKFRGVVINNSSENAKFIDCSFSSNKGLNSIIFNKRNLNLINCIFYDNKCNFYIIDSFDEESILSLFGGELIDNNAKKATIFNSGESCTIDKTIFMGNYINSRSANDVYNETYLSLQAPQFKSNTKTVFNKGQIDIRKFSNEDVERSIENLGNIEFYDDISQEYPQKDEKQERLFNFSDLDDLIHLEDDVKTDLGTIVNRGSEVLISLKSDISLENYERDFYEGGIDLDDDNLTIDGNNNVIDANEKSRIFNVIGKNIVLKNIIFKNAKYFIGTSKQEHLDGGGAIKIIKGSSLKLIGCKFINNFSEDNGGAVLNNGELTSANCYFNNNESKCYSGAIHNSGNLVIENNEFNENASKIAGAIYNLGNLTIGNIILNKNSSNISQSIYNANSISLNSGAIVKDEIYNTSNVNPVEDMMQKSFIYLESQLVNSNSIVLKEDIKFDYETDNRLKKGIDINSEFVIDGNGHSIDGNFTASFFNVNAKVTFKDLIFKNGVSQVNALINNNSQIIFKNCKFLNNRITRKSNLIDNNGSLTFENCSFYNNLSKNVLLWNKDFLEFHNVLFINNNIYDNTSIIYNETYNKVIISNSTFKYNTSIRELIINGREAELMINDIEFKNNESKATGLIQNFGNTILSSGIFSNNHTKTSGIINNQDYGRINIDFSEFNQNYAEGYSVISNSGELFLNECNFTGNISKSKLGGVILSKYGNLMQKNCEFRNNSPKDIVK